MKNKHIKNRQIDKIKFNKNKKSSNVTKSWSSAKIEIGLYFLYSFFIFLISEWIYRRSLVKCFAFMLDYPVAFFVNWVLLFLVFGIAIFLAKKIFYLYIATFLSLLLVISSSLVNQMRGMPISPYDL